MTTYNTMNPVPSADARDRYDNSQVFDELMNGAAPSTPDRLGVLRQSWAGMELAFAQFLANSGFELPAITYAAGVVIERPSQLISYMGNIYSVKASSDFPYTLNGTFATDEPNLVLRSDESLRSELAAADGVFLVGGAITSFDSMGDLELSAGRVDGDAAYLKGWYETSHGYGNGVFMWRSGSTAVSNRGTVVEVIGNPSGRWERPNTHLVTPDDFGIFHEDVPTTDQTARVQSFLDAIGGRPLSAGRAMTVGINSGVRPSSNTYMVANGFKLYALDTFVGTPLIGFMVEFIGVNDVYLHEFLIDGNQAGTAGGLSPAVGGDHPRGFGVLDSNKRITLDNCRAENVWGNGFISFSGGAVNPLSTDVRFKDCVAKGCGVGLGQEIRNSDVSGGPSRVIYDNCHADLCNRGLYIAGGHAHIIGGYYHSKRQNALITYTGDSHAPTYVTGEGSPRFRVTPEVGSNSVWLAHCIDKAASTPNFNLQQYLKVEMTGARFECDHTGINVEIETGSNITLHSPTFIGGGVQLLGKVTTSTGGPYRSGVVTINDPTFMSWANNADAVLPGIPITLNNPMFIEPSGDLCGCIRLTGVGQRVVVNAPRFGSVGAIRQPLNGISSSVDGTIVECSGAIDNGLIGTLFNVGASNAEQWRIENSYPSNLLDAKKWRSATSAPSVGTWSRGEIVWNSAPSAGGTIGFVCVVAGTPGTWKTFAPITA